MKTPCLIIFIILHCMLSHLCAETGILFESYLVNNFEICRIDPDGSHRINITKTPKIHELYPQASPDGSQIAFLVDDHANGKITRSLWYMNVDGSNRIKVTDGARHVTWSPDGTQLAFSKQEFKKFRVKDYVTKYLYFYDLHSKKITVHANEKIEHLYVPSWHKDGEWIVSTVHGGMGFGHAIIGIEVNGNRIVDLKIPGCRPNLSPDGKRITWSSNDHTVEVADVSIDANGPSLSNRRVLFKHAKLHLYHPDFSPDSKHITFSMGPGGRVPASGPGTQAEVAEMTGVRGPWNIYVRQVDSDDAPKQLTFDSSLSNKESDWIETK